MKTSELKEIGVLAMFNKCPCCGEGKKSLRIIVDIHDTDEVSDTVKAYCMNCRMQTVIYLPAVYSAVVKGA